MIDLGIDIANSFIRYGLNWAFVAAAVIGVLKNRNAIMQLLHKGKRQETQMDRIERNQLRIMKHLGIEGEPWKSPQKHSQYGMRWKAKMRRYTRLFKLYSAATYPVVVRYRRILMKKLKSRKFILAVVSAALIILNDGLDLGVSAEAVYAFAGVVALWITGESVVDTARAAKGASNDDNPPVQSEQ